MKRPSILLAVLAMVCGLGLSTATSAAPPGDGAVVVADRASGTVSVIDVATDMVVDTVALPSAGAEPMYVVYVKSVDRFFVGDRGNNEVVAFDADTFDVVGTVTTGNGVFHMWAGGTGRQLWVNNDVDDTVTVVDTGDLSVVATIDMPGDLTSDGGKPHDVVVSRNGRSAFVSMVGLGGPDDYVLKYDARTFEEVDRVAVGKDPHLALPTNGRRLYVPTQNANEVAVFDTSDLSPVTDIPVPAAHGAAMASGGIFYTTNIAGGGTDGLVTIDIQGKGANTVVDATDTPYAIPHNVVVAGSAGNSKVYVTHSGATADQVSIYTASAKDPVPVHLADVTVGTNPFGLAYVP